MAVCSYIILGLLPTFVLSLPGHSVATNVPADGGRQIKAIVPTVAGQIGINPVTSDTGPVSTYVGSVDPWTQYLAVQGGRTNWVASNNYVTETTIATDLDGVSTTVVETISASVGTPTATAADGSVDVPILLGSGLVSELIDVGQQICGKTKAKRQSCALILAKQIQPLLRARLLGQLAAAGVAEIALSMVIAKLYESNGEIPNSINLPGQVQSSGGVASPPTSTDSGSCWLYTGSNPVYSEADTYTVDQLLDDDPGNSDDNDKRSVSRRDGTVSLLIDKIGKCDSKKFPFTPFKRTAKYWDRRQIMLYTPETNWWYVPDQTNGRTKALPGGEECIVARLVQKGKQTDARTGDFDKLVPPPYKKANDPPAPALGVDHVYESSMLETLFSFVLSDPNDVRCQPFIETFSKVDQSKPNPADSKNGGMCDMRWTPNRLNDIRFQSLWFLQPNKVNKAFAGLDQNINGVKGKMLNDGIPDLQKVETLSTRANAYKNLNLWNDIAMAFDYLRVPIVNDLFQKVHADMYKGLYTFDKIQDCESNPVPQTSWSEEYAKWAPKFLSDQQASVVARVSEITSALAKPEITLDPQTGKKNEVGKAFDGMIAQYGQPDGDTYSFDTASLLSLPPPTTINIRDDGGFQCTYSGGPKTTLGINNSPGPTGLPRLPGNPVCTTRQDKGNGVCPQVILPTTTGVPCPPLTTPGQSCADIKSTPTPTPAPGPPVTGPVSPDGIHYVQGRDCIRGSPKDQRLVFPRDMAIRMINDFCTKEKPDIFRGTCVESLNSRGPASMYISAHLATSQDDPRCPMAPANNFDDLYPDWVDMCKFALTSAVDNCEVDSYIHKSGGWNMLYCMKFQIFAVKSGYQMDECPK